jgi:von Willebrand factor A domain-containing protein 7
MINFSDVEPILNTGNPTEMLQKLNSTVVSGGGDCPELALTGIKNALKHAMSNSVGFVFSDASAKDFNLESEIMPILQKRQITLNFFLTGTCKGKWDPGYKVYENLALRSGGQVFDMKRSNVRDVLNALKHTTDPNFVPLAIYISENAGKITKPLEVDQSINKIWVSVSGKNPKLIVRDPDNQVLNLGCKLLLENLNMGCITDPKDGKFAVEASADSKFSVSFNALSDLKFDFGFTLRQVLKKSETNIQPLVRVKNVLSIFPSQPDLVETLVVARILTIDTDREFNCNLRKLMPNLYNTEPFDIPNEAFKIFVKGTDKKGNKIDRLISTSVTPIEPG